MVLKGIYKIDKEMAKGRKNLRRLVKEEAHDFHNRDAAIVYIDSKYYEDTTHMQCIMQFYNDIGEETFVQDSVHRPQNEQFLEISEKFGPVVLAHKVDAEDLIYLIIEYKDGQMFDFDGMDKSIKDDFEKHYGFEVADEMNHINSSEVDNKYNADEKQKQMMERDKEMQGTYTNLEEFMRQHGFEKPTGEYGEDDIFVKGAYMVSQYDVGKLMLNEFGKEQKIIDAKEIDKETNGSNEMFDFVLTLDNVKLDRGLNDVDVSFTNKAGQQIDLYLYHEDLDIDKVDGKNFKGSNDLLRENTCSLELLKQIDSYQF